MRLIAFLCTCFALLASAQTVPSRYEDLVMSEVKDGPATSLFKPGTDRVFVRGKLPGALAGTKVKSEWIAVKVKGVDPNYKIDAYEMALSPGTNNVMFSLSKPTAGWPEGDFRVDLFIEGKAAGNLPFKVAK